MLCYKIQNKKNYDTAIEHIQLIVTNLKKDLTSNSYKYHGHISKGYQWVNYGFGRREKNRFLAYKRSSFS